MPPGTQSPSQLLGYPSFCLWVKIRTQPGGESNLCEDCEPLNWEKTDPAELSWSAAGDTSVFTSAMTHTVTWRRDHITWLWSQCFHSFCLEINVWLFLLLAFMQNGLLKNFLLNQKVKLIYSYPFVTAQCVTLNCMSDWILQFQFIYNPNILPVLRNK